MNWITYVILFILGFSLLSLILSVVPPKFRSAENPADYGLTYERVEFKTKDKVGLVGWLIGKDKRKPVILISHGYPFDKGNILPVVKFLYPEYNIFLFDMRSFGESEGIITTAGAKEIEDAKAAYAFLKKRGFRKIGAYGFSMSASVFLMSELDFFAIVADSPYASLQRMIEQTYRYLGPLKWPFVWVTNIYSRLILNINPSAISPANKIKIVQTPVLLIHGTRDSQIPVENSKEIYSNAGKNVELWLIEADHGMSYAVNPNRYKNKVMAFFKKHDTRR